MYWSARRIAPNSAAGIHLYPHYITLSPLDHRLDRYHGRAVHVRPPPHIVRVPVYRVRPDAEPVRYLLLRETLRQ